jgi:cytochrome c peroxidase
MNKNLISAMALTLTCLAMACQKATIQEMPEISSSSLTIAGQSNLTPKELLGKMIYFDANLSEPVGRQACASCHLPDNGYTGFASLPLGGQFSGAVAGIGEGAFPGRFGNRRAPSSAYATFSPVLKMIEDNEFKGGASIRSFCKSIRTESPNVFRCFKQAQNSCLSKHLAAGLGFSHLYSHSRTNQREL